MIRPAALADLDRMVELGQRFHQYAGVAEIPFDPASFRSTLTRGLGDAEQCYLVAEVDGVILAMAGAVAYSPYFNHAAKTGQELFWWSECGEGMRLHAALAEWAAGRSCQTFSMIALADERSGRMARLYTRMGYRPTEQSFIKRL
jgi:hypothetical protein